MENKDSMDAVFPLIKKYGGVVVGLTLDEDGIPATAEGRVKVAGKIIEEAKKYGIDKKDIVIDVLCMTISSEPTVQAITTLEASETGTRKIWSLYGAWCIQHFLWAAIPTGGELQFLYYGNAVMA